MFMQQAKSATSQGEFTAVVLAGAGSKLGVLTDKTPKALLPVGAGKKMIEYTMEYLLNIMIFDIYLCIIPSTRSVMEDWLKTWMQQETRLRIRIFESPEGSGSADVLRYIGKQIKTSDFLVLSCDYFSSSGLPRDLLNLHILRSSAVSCLLYRQELSEADIRNKASNATGEFIAIENKSSRLIMITSKAEVEDDELELRSAILKRFPCINIHSRLRDAHIYVFKRGIIDLISKQTKMRSLKQDLIPYLLSLQYKPDREVIDKILIDKQDLLDAGKRLSSFKLDDQKDVVCLAHVAFETSETYYTRVNTISKYNETNRWIIKAPASEEARVASSAVISSKTQISNDSLVGPGSNIGERCSIKKTIIGSHCKIGANVKLSNCIVWDYVTIEDGAKMDGVIICHRAKIESGASLKDTEVGANSVISSNS